jgi:hypothetical protein
MKTPEPAPGSSPGSADAGPNLKDRAREELQKYLIVAAYLYVCFGVALIYKSALLQEEGVNFLPHGLAAIKALILGKFILVGDAVGLGTRLRVSNVAMAVAARTLVFFVFLVLLSIAEELIAGRIHGKPFAATLADYEQGSVRMLLSECLLLLVVLIPLITANEISRYLGPGGLRGLLFGDNTPDRG